MIEKLGSEREFNETYQNVKSTISQIHSELEDIAKPYLIEGEYKPIDKNEIKSTDFFDEGERFFEESAVKYDPLKDSDFYILLFSIAKHFFGKDEQKELLILLLFTKFRNSTSLALGFWSYNFYYNQRYGLHFNDDIQKNVDLSGIYQHSKVLLLLYFSLFFLDGMKFSKKAYNSYLRFFKGSEELFKEDKKL
jgi:hypothetical protein